MKSPRIAGLDLANALALPGLFLASFTLVLTDVFTKTVVIEHDLLRDMWACLFLFVSGMIVTVTMHGARKRSRSKKKYFVRKGVVFLFLGIACSLIWPVNLLIVMGVMFLAAPYLALLNSNILKSFMVIVFLAAVFIYQFGEINFKPTHVALDVLKPNSLINFLSNAAISGYYALIPWSGFFLAGMVFARNDIMQKRIVRLNNVAGFIGLALGIIVQLLWVVLNPPVHISATASSLPYQFILIVHTPAFVIIGTSMCVLIVNTLVQIGSKNRNNKLVKAIAQIGSMKQSLYLAHLVIGCALLVGFNSYIFGSYDVVLFVTGAVMFSLFVLALFWKKRYNFGPVEWAINRLSGSNDKS